MKKILTYSIWFCGVLLLCILFLIITTKIPKKLVNENIKKSTSCFRTKKEIEKVVRTKPYTFLHPYADAMILNIICCSKEDQPLKSILEAKYYMKNSKWKITNTIISYDFKELVDNQYEGNIQYLRYWHGSTRNCKDITHIYEFRTNLLF